MSESRAVSAPVTAERSAATTVYALLFAISFAHLLNDTIQALLPSIYPLLKTSYQLSFAQLGLITFTFQLSASLLQPVVGFVTDRKSMPYSLAVGMGLTGVGLISLAMASSFVQILLSAALIGSGSAIFHPEASRIAFMAAGRRRGFAQSFFQVGGNAGSAIGPLLAAVIVVPHGQRSLLGFSIMALAGMFLLYRIGKWQAGNGHRLPVRVKSAAAGSGLVIPPQPRKVVVRAIAILVALTFSKYVYLASLTSYYTFYLMDRFGVSKQSSILYLFVFLFAVAVGTIVGGPVGDKIGRKRVIWASILGVAPFSLWLPHAGLEMTAILSAIIGMILASAFSAILVYAQELMPGKVGMVAGLFFGLAFGIAGVGSAVLGKVADQTSINFVFHICAYLPLIGLLTVFLPNIEGERNA